MSQEEAKKTLGFPPEAQPTPEEVQKAWKTKVFEIHPDRGGTHDEVVQVNVARDILEGKARPTYERSESSPVPTTPQHNWTPPKKTGETFEQAEAKAGIPSGVTWLFVTDRQRGSSNWSSDESSKSDVAWAAYGKTENEHIFVGVRHYTRVDYYAGAVNNTDAYVIKCNHYPVHGADGSNPAWLYGNVVKALKQTDFEGSFNSKVVDAAGWHFSDKRLTGTLTSIKHWLVNSGAVAGDDPSVAGRKSTIEITHCSSRDPKPGYYAEKPNRINFFDGKYTGDYHHVELVINGKSHDLNDVETTKLFTLRMGGKLLVNLIFGDYLYPGEGTKKKMLARLKVGKVTMNWLAENAHSLPQGVRDLLKTTAAGLK